MGAEGAEQALRVPGVEVAPGIVDCDVHNALPSPAALKPHLEARWHGYYDQGHPLVQPGQMGMVIGARPGGFFREDAAPETSVPGSDYELMREQLLDGCNVRRAVLCPLDAAGWGAYGEVAAELCRAENRWVAAEWLNRDERLRAAITIPVEDGSAAATEVRRVAAEDARFVAVLLLLQTREGLGHPKYWPIYEAAVECDLPIILHVGGFSGVRYSTGVPPYFLEHHAQIPQIYATQLTSLLYGQVAERFPDLRLVLTEGGVAWIPALMWRLDRVWSSTRRHVPHLKRPPSEIVRERFWLTTQPFDEPESRAQLLEMLQQLDMTDKLMYSSDYPHWDYDDPTRVLPRSLVGDAVRAQVFSDNAERCFKLS